MMSFDSKKFNSDLFETNQDINVVDDYNQNRQISVSEMFYESLYLGATSFGSFKHQTYKIMNAMHHDKRYITLKSFNTILSFCEHLPGPTSTQVIVCISVIKTSSILGTLLGFIGYILPGLLSSLIISSLIYYLGFYFNKVDDINDGSPLTIISTNYHINYYLHVIISGLNQGSLSILLINGFEYSKPFSKSFYHLFIIFLSSFLYYFYDSFPLIILIIIICGLLSFFKRDQDYLIGLEDFTVNLQGITFIGTQCLIAFLVVYIFILLSVLYFQSFSINFSLIERFFRMGSIILGGGASVIPFILTELSLEHLIGEFEVLTGFSIISMLPGPVFNIACIIGTFINGPISGLFSSLLLFLPGVLIILWALPFVKYFRQMYTVQRFLSGVNCCGTGFIFASCFKLWIIACVHNPYSNWIIGSINCMFTGILITMFDIIEPLALVSSSVFLLAVKIILKI